MKIGLGVTTVNRPEFLEKCLKSILRHANVDCLYVHDDYSDPKYKGAYARALKPLIGKGEVIFAPENHGVAYAKNRLFEAMMAEGCDWMFICEDDIKVTAPEAVTEYLRIAKATDLHHLSFAHHGEANIGGPVEVDGDVAFYPHSIGAWCLYSRECLEVAGLFDENLVNAWEHVEHELRLCQFGFLPNAGPHRFPDATHSASWLVECPNSIDKSSIRPRPDWHANIRNGLIYWRDNKPETYAMLFGPGMPLSDYARSITG